MSCRLYELVLEFFLCLFLSLFFFYNTIFGVCVYEGD